MTNKSKPLRKEEAEGEIDKAIEIVMENEGADNEKNN